MRGSITSIALGCGLAFGLCNGAAALERGIVPFPAGAAGTNIARLPPVPGLFMLQQFSYADADNTYGDNGKPLPVPFHTTALAETTRLMASYPMLLWGAHLYSQLVLPVVKLDADIAHVDTRQTALGNVTVSPAILQWSVTPELAVAAAVDLTFRSGAYTPIRPSVAFGYFSTQPLVAIRYAVPNGPEVGITNRFIFNNRNSDTDYRSGNTYVGEFLANWTFDHWKLGVVGSYVDQFSDDRQHGASVPLNGNRARALSGGPSVLYEGKGYSVGVNYQPGVTAHNMPKTDRMWLNFAFRLF